MSTVVPFQDGMRLGQGFNSYNHTPCLERAVYLDPSAAPVGSDSSYPADLPQLKKPANVKRPAFKPRTADVQRFTDKVKVGAEALKTVEGSAPPPIDDFENDPAKHPNTKPSTSTQPQEPIDPTKPISEPKITPSPHVPPPPPPAPQVKREFESHAIKQNVKYTVRFFTKASEVANELNISGAMGIKTGSINASGSGTYFDAEKAHSSDINIMVRVEVRNGSDVIPAAWVFNTIPEVNDRNFPDVYGDSFVSGFISGGEFVATISIKLRNKADKQHFMGQLQASLGAVSGEIKGNYDSKNLGEDTTTTINVNWSGGGYVKDFDTPWDLESVIATASCFPDLVASCPQVTFAILTPYANLKSYHDMRAKKPSFSVHDYKNAKIYTDDLLDDYMDYKALLQKTRAMKNDLGLLALGPERKDAYEPNARGLARARADIHKNMARIVGEVDAITKYPKHAFNAVFDSQRRYPAPDMFARRLPRKDTQINPKAWQWRKISNYTYAEHNSNKSSLIAVGAVSHEAMMVKAYEFEILNKPEKVVAFDSDGQVKVQLVPMDKLVLKMGCDLYVRVLLDEDEHVWEFLPGARIVGNLHAESDGAVFRNNDVKNRSQVQDEMLDHELPRLLSNDINITEALTTARANPRIQAFDSWYSFEEVYTIRPNLLEKKTEFSQFSHLGTWIRKSAQEAMVRVGESKTVTNLDAQSQVAPFLEKNKQVAFLVLDGNNASDADIHQSAKWWKDFEMISREKGTKVKFACGKQYLVEPPGLENESACPLIVTYEDGAKKDHIYFKSGVEALKAFVAGHKA